MAVRYIGMTQVFPQLGRSIVIGAASGGTLAGAQVVQVVFDDATFAATAEGKQRLVAAIEAISQGIETAKSWPVDSTS